jgi:hypothetical protein
VVSDDGALFGREEVPVGGIGPAEAALNVAVQAGEAAGTLVAEDAALVAAARHAARAMDWTMRTPSPKAIYAVAQSLTAYRETLHALRLPTAIAITASALRGGKPAGEEPDEPKGDPLRDLFGTPGS